MRVLVTGGGGFIASHLVDKLIKMGTNLTVLDNCYKHDLGEEIKIHFNKDNFKFVKGDLRNRTLVETLLSDVDVVYHFASIVGTSVTIKDPILVTDVNVIGTLTMLEASLKKGVKYFIYPTTPDVPWLNPYKITKATAEKFCQMFYETYGFKTVCLCLTNVYGPRERLKPFQKVVPTFIKNALLEKPLPVFGDGEQSADYIYVSDVVEACVLAPEDSAAGKVIPIGTGVSTTVNELARIIIRLTGSRSRIQHLPMRKGETKVHIKADVEKAVEYLGWKPTISLEEGLKKTIPYYKRLIENQNDNTLIT